MNVRERLFIDGEWVKPSTGETIGVVDSTTEEVIGRVPAGTPEDVDRAATAAARAFPGWAALPRDERAKLMKQVSERLAARTDEIADTVTHELGMPLNLSKIIQVGLPVGTFADASQRLDDVAWEEEVGESLVVREPVGVVGAITPWNYPLHQIANKVAPAMAVGCTVVVKPSEVTPLNAFYLAEVLAEVGVPPGVFNLVTGTGPVVGEAIAGHRQVDAVSFTGSTRAGKRVMTLAADTVKRVALQLGGKSASVLLDDADLASAVPASVFACFMNSGQTCSAHTRMVVPRARLGEVEELATQSAQGLAVGDPFDPGSLLGPLVSSVQRDRVRGYIERGTSDGARKLLGGSDPPEGLDRGYFVRPTVFSDVDPGAVIAQEEIFGPVLSIIPYDHEEEAVDIANSTIYGLAGGVWSADPDRAERVARRMRTGQVDINGGPFNPVAPFGGYKQSGFGRELGKFGLEEFLEIKSLQRR